MQTIPERQILVTLDKIKNPFSFHPENRGYLNLAQAILDPEGTVLFIRDTIEYVKPIIDELLTDIDSKEQDVIVRKYGLKGHTPADALSIAAALHCKVSKVREYEEHALDSFRERNRRSLIETIAFRKKDSQGSRFSVELDTLNKYGEDAERYLVNEAVEFRKNANYSADEKNAGYFEDLFRLLLRNGYSVIYSDTDVIQTGKKSIKELIETDRRHCASYDRTVLIQEVYNFPSETGRGVPITRINISPSNMRRIINKGCLYSGDLKGKLPALLFDEKIEKEAIRTVLMIDAVPIALVSPPEAIYGTLASEGINSLSQLLSLNLRNNKEQKRGLTEFVDLLETISQEYGYQIAF